MLDFVNNFFKQMRPAFSRNATHCWFVVVIIGTILKYDALGVTSIIRALNLEGAAYFSILHFYHSSSYNIQSLSIYWTKFVLLQQLHYIVNDRLVIISDNTDVPKEGTKMPGVCVLKNKSETSSKPNHFRGHQWNCTSILINLGKKALSIPLFSNIVFGYEPVEEKKKNTTSITSTINNILNLLISIGKKGYVICDAFYATRNTFINSAKVLCNETKEQLLHV